MVFGFFGRMPSVGFQQRFVRLGLVLWGSCILAAVGTFIVGPPGGRVGKRDVGR